MPPFPYKLNPILRKPFSRDSPELNDFKVPSDKIYILTIAHWHRKSLLAFGENFEAVKLHCELSGMKEKWEEVMELKKEAEEAFGKEAERICRLVQDTSRGRSRKAFPEAGPDPVQMGEEPMKYVVPIKTSEVAGMVNEMIEEYWRSSQLGSVFAGLHLSCGARGEEP